MDYVPPRPKKLLARYEVSPRRFRVWYRNRWWGNGVLIVFFLGIVLFLMVRQELQHPDPRLIPVAAALGVAMLFTLCWYFGAEILEIEEGSVRIVNRRRPWPRRRIIALSGVQDFTVDAQIEKSEESGRVVNFLRIGVSGESIRLFPDLPRPELRWLASQLSQFLAGPDQGSPDPPSFPRLMVLTDEPVAPLAAGRWWQRDDGGLPRFFKRGGFKPTMILEMLVANGLVNGVMLVFWHQLLEPGPNLPGNDPLWLMALLLIPFQAVGLVFLANLLYLLFDPIHRTSLSFGVDSIELRHTWLGIGPRWRFDADRLARIELDEIPSDQIVRRVASKRQGRPITADPTYALLLVDRDNVEVFSIPVGSQTEGRWIADCMLRSRPNWFEPAT